MYLSWIIPTRNEERRIEKTVREVDAYLRSKSFPGGYEILVVDGASHDKTQEIVNRLVEELGTVRLVETEPRGKGWNVKEGMLAGKGDIRLFSDADNATSPDHFDKMIPLFEAGNDVVISSRNPKDVAGSVYERPESGIRQLAGKMGNVYIQFAGVSGIWDTQNGFKAATAKAAEDIFSHLTILGFAFDVEMLVITKIRKYKMGIIPVHWKHDPDSKVTAKAYLQVLMDVTKIGMNRLMGKYK